MAADAHTGTSLHQKCNYCGLYHEAKCPLVKAFEYHPDGTLKRVEFFEPPAVQVSPVTPNLALAGAILDLPGWQA